MALNKKFFPKVAAADALVPSENFNTVLYTGNGSTQRIGGYINRGAVFNGSSSTITNTSQVIPNGATSISFWYNANGNTGTQYILGQGVATASKGITVYYSSSSFGALVAKGTSSLAGATTPTTTYSSTDWHHILCTWDGTTSTNALKVYVNGSLEAQGTIDTSSSSIGAYTYFAIGGLQGGTYAAGVVDQVRIFNKALSSSEITTLSNETHASTTISTTDIFSDNSGVALYQLDGNANDTGGVSGKFGAGGIFNGSANVTTSLDFSNLTDYTISMWLFVASAPSNTEFFAGTIQNTSALNGIYLGVETDGDIRFYERNASDSATALVSTDSITFGSWNHIVAVRDGSTNYLYINNGTPVSASNSTITHATDFTIGRAGAYTTRPVVGKIDDVRIYSDVLTSTEVGYLYNNTTASIPTDNLVAYYKLDGDARDEQQIYDGVATNVSYAYDGTATNVTYQEATSFTPDLIWVKKRDAVHDHKIADSVRGATKIIESSTTDAEITATGSINAFHTNGFAVGSDSSVNGNGNDFVAWCFKGGGADVLNENGSINSQVSANQDAGFSIVKHTAPSSEQNYTIGHGLSQKPDMVILKGLDSSSSWFVWHKDLSVESYYLYLNGTFAESGLTQDTRIWGQQSFTDTVISTRANYTTALNQDYISYCFHSVDGYSKVGSYTGTGASGNMVETGFEPAFILIKGSSGTGRNWVIKDNKRDTTNPNSANLYPNLSNAENTVTSLDINFLSNGFSLEGTSGDVNANTETYIYLAIAADPDTTTPTVEDSFDVVTYSGSSTSGTGQTIQFDFNPDLVITKSRTTNTSWAAMDTVRGAGSKLRLNLTSAELDNTFGGIQSFNGDGSVTFEGTSDTGDVDYTGRNYVAYAWKAGDHDDNLPQINTEGSIDSVVSVNADAGFSIVKYTGNGTAGSTIGHGLSSAPQMIIIKNLDGTANWAVYTETTGTNATLLLNSSSASTSVSNKYAGTNSTVFGVNSASDVNTSGNEYIAYCFHSVSGYQKIGSYTGGTANQVITTGFKPRFILIKGIDSATADHWVIYDTVRSPSNPMDELLLPNLSDAENVNNTNHQISSENNGFKLITTSTQTNASGGDYIYLAIK